MLKVRCGPYAALEQAFLRQLDSLQKDDPFTPIAVVAPSRRMAERLERLAAGRPRLAVRFHTFHSLALQLVREDGQESRKLVGDPLLFDRLVDSLLGSGPRPKGLASSYRSTLKDLIDAGVEPRAGELVDEGLLSGKEEAERLRGLLDLLARYEKSLEQLGVLTPAGLVRRAAELAPKSAALGRFKALLYYGFYDLVGLQAEFFEAVAGEFPVTLYFPYRKGHPAYAFADRFFETKLHQGGTVPEPVEAPAEPLGDALFVPGRSAKAPEGFLRFLTASGASDEAWRVAKEILRLVEEEGVLPSEIGVVARALDPYRSALADAFRASAVPFHMSAEEPLLKRPAARACWTLLALARREFPALSVLDLTASPFFKLPPGASAGRWSALVRRLRIHRGWLQWEGRLPGEDAALWTLLKELKAELEPKGRRSWGEWAEYAAALLDRRFDAGGDEAFKAVLDELCSLEVLDLLGGKPEFPEFLEALDDRLHSAGLPVTDEPNQGVSVLDAMEARGSSFRVLFLVGLKQGLFPRVIREDPLLRDRARKALRDAGGYWIGQKKDGYDEEKLLFHLLVSSARERLYCCWPRSDEEGRSQVPSIYLFDLFRAAGLDPKRLALREDVPRQPERRLCSNALAPYLTPREASLAAALAGADPWSLHKALGWEAGALKALREGALELDRYGAPGPKDGVVGPLAEHLAWLKGHGLSPSTLENLAACPFRYLASKVLKLAEPEEPCEASKVDPARAGTLYHEALEAFYRHPKAKGDVRAAVDASFGKLDWRAMGLYPLLWEFEKERMARALEAFLRWDLAEQAQSGFVPELFEQGLDGKLEVALPKALEGMRFHGRADRLDSDGKSFRVVDYKRTAKSKKLAKRVSEGEALQPPVYLELAAQRKEFAGQAQGGAVFYPVESFLEEPEPDPYTAQDHAALRKAVLERIGALLKAVAEGRFVIKPQEGEQGYCDWCPFPAVCRKNHAMTLVRARRAP
ncbi:MAG TPA: hypothetical protein DCM05_17170 [Elusimicrobia bacterium]|nr:hypothetical protein [Elusimicrobiota bacterium]